MDLREMKCGGMRWVHLAQERVHRQTLVNTVIIGSHDMLEISWQG